LFQIIRHYLEQGTPPPALLSVPGAGGRERDIRLTKRVSIERMFEHRSYEAWRSVSPPRPVIVRLVSAFPPANLTWARGLPLWVRSGGFDVSAEVPGELYGWVLSSTGRWWASVRFRVQSRNGDLGLDLDQLVPADAVRPIDQTGGP
jgi:hypothetical protein